MDSFVYIICELNPPHSGHAHLFSEARRLYPDAVVVAVMSSHMTERGSPAVTDKFTRARAALSLGADLILSLPFPFSCSSAEYFARGGTAVISSFANAFPEAHHSLVFGSECGDADALRLAAARTSSDEYRARLYASENGGHNARDMRSLYSEMYGEEAARILDGANDVLAIEYIRALSQVAVTPCAIRRVGARHDGETSDGIASASAIRAMISDGDLPLALSFMPHDAADIISSAITERGAAYEARMGAAIHAILRMMEPEAADVCAECSGGVGRRLISAALSSRSYSEMMSVAATKQYTNARLRRAAVFAAAGVPARALGDLPAYTRLLAANRRGSAVLREYKGALPVLTKFADNAALGEAAKRQAELEAREDRLYTLAFPSPLHADVFLKTSPFIG